MCTDTPLFIFLQPDVRDSSNHVRATLRSSVGGVRETLGEKPRGWTATPGVAGHVQRRTMYMEKHHEWVLVDPLPNIWGSNLQ